MPLDMPPFFCYYYDARNVNDNGNGTGNDSEKNTGYDALTGTTSLHSLGNKARWTPVPLISYSPKSNLFSKNNFCPLEVNRKRCHSRRPYNSPSLCGGSVRKHKGEILSISQCTISLQSYSSRENASYPTHIITIRNNRRVLDENR